MQLGGEGWVPYANRPEWGDVTPLPASGVTPGSPGDGVTAVTYSEAARDALGYFNAVLASGERSHRVLALTADAIAANPAHYSAWQLRWTLLQELGCDLEEEILFTQQVADDGAKNYQLWNHRRKLAAARPGSAEEELAFAARALAEDAKNYHAWAHRQAAAAAAGSWEAEQQYASEMLDRDVRNNSAWNQRMFVLKHTLGQHTSYAALLSSELSYVASKLALDYENQSAWNYLLGLFHLPGAQPHALGRVAQVHMLCAAALQARPSCSPALDVLAQHYASQAAASVAAGAERDAAAAASAALHALNAAGVADPMREAYWAERRRALQLLLPAHAAAAHISV